MKISFGLFFTLIFLTSEKISEVDYKGVQQPISIFVQRFSPAFAALEDTFEIKSKTSSDIIKNFQTQVTSIKSGEPEFKSDIKVVKLEGFKIQQQTSNAKALANVTQKISTVAKNIFETSFDLSSNVSMSPQKIMLSAPEELNLRKKIDVDGVDFEIGSPVAISNASKTDLNDGIQFNLNNVLPNLLNLRRLSSATKNENANLSDYVTGLGNSNTPNYSKAQLLKGQIELTGGAVYPGERFQFYVQRVLGGVVQERGEINSWTGEFSITIKEPKGQLLVELRHDSGALLALGQLQINPKLIKQAENIVKIYPAEDAHHIGQVLSYESFDEFEVAVNETSQIYIDGENEVGQTDAKGRILNTGTIMPGSQLVVSASHKGYWNSLQIAEAGQPLKTIMHSDKHMKSFLQLIEPYLKTAQIHSVIWGRVTDRGHALSQVKVSLHGFEDIQPLYFSYRIPDPNLEATSSDGFFAFINPPEGLHIVKTNQPNMPLESVLVRMDHTSLVSLETAPKRNVNIYSYEAFGENQTVPAKISIPGTEKQWGVGGSKSATLPFFDTATNMVMDVEPVSSDFYPTRFFIGRRRASVEVPQFRKAWLDSILSSQKINIVPRTTSLIGWIEKGSYTLNIYPKTESTRLVYFNKEGNVVDALSDGGGYIVVNVPPGVITSTLKNTETSKLIKRLSISEPYRLSVNYINDLD